MLATAVNALQAGGHRVRAVGLDINAQAAEAARARLGPATSTDIQVANLLTQTTSWEESADLVISEPPWGLSWRAESDGVQEMASNGHYPYGLGRESDSTWLFVQRSIDLIRTDPIGAGRAVLLVAPSSLTDRPGRQIRGALCEDDVLEGIVRLPEGLAANTSIPLYLLLLRARKPKAMQGKSHIIDLQPFLTTSGHRRTLRPEALRVLWSSLAMGRPGPHNRVVTLTSFRKRDLSVQTVSSGTASWSVQVPSTHTTQWLDRRYGPAQVSTHSPGDEYVEFAAELGDADDRAPASWPTTRLSAVLMSPPAVEASGGHDAAGASIFDANVWLPTGNHTEVTSTPVAADGRVLRLAVDPSRILPDFLTGWLNSESGHRARRTALQRASTGNVINIVRSDTRSLWRLVDELVIPLPGLDAQQKVSEAALKLKRVENTLTQARSDLWTEPARADLIVGPFEPLLDPSLTRWTSSLPYPFASALWTLMSRSSIEAKHRQMFLTWESYGGFLATTLLSVMKQDVDFASAEGPALRRALDGAGLSLERATLGTWAVIVERLGSVFRAMLNSGDEDEQSRLRQLFGGAEVGVIEALLSPKCVTLLREVNARRNAWAGHGGATTETTLQRQIDHLMSLLEDLRSAVGSAWEGLPLVRAGAARRKGGEYVQDVERVMGTSTPFSPQQLRVGEIMEEGELYLATDGCAEPVPLNHLVVLRSSPPDQRFSCYFFNRTSASSARLVSYQMTETGEIEEPLDQLGLGLPWLLDPPR